MAPLSLPLSSLLKHTDCLRKANIFCYALHGFHRRPSGPVLWKRNFGAVVHGVGKLLSHHSGGKNYAASLCSSLSGGQDTTEKLWSAYKQTKRQTEGTDRSLQHLPILPLANSYAVDTKLLSPDYKPVMTDVSISIITISRAYFLLLHVFCRLYFISHKNGMGRATRMSVIIRLSSKAKA